MPLRERQKRPPTGEGWRTDLQCRLLQGITRRARMSAYGTSGTLSRCNVLQAGVTGVGAAVKGLLPNLVNRWSEWGDLNSRPPAPEAGALPGCATLRWLKSPRIQTGRQDPAKEPRT